MMNLTDHDQLIHMLGDPDKLVNLLTEIIEIKNTTPSRPGDSGSRTGHKEKRMNMGKMFSAEAMMSRMFKRAENVVWDLMSGKIGIIADDAICTLDGAGDDARVNQNLITEFGAAIPAFAQNTPFAAVQVGDIIVRERESSTGWVIEKNDDKGSFRIMKVTGDMSTFKPPKITTFGLESGVMVLRPLFNMLPGGAAGLGSMQGMLMPMMMMAQMNGEEPDFENIMPMVLMSQMGTMGALTGSGTADPNTPQMQNMMAQMLPMMMMTKMMGGKDKNEGSFSGAKPFSRKNPF
jgi:hypothetical protein